MEDISNTPFLKEKDVPREQAKEKFSALVEKAKTIFTGSSFVRGGAVYDYDLAAIKVFYKEAAGISPAIFNPSTQRHLDLAGKYARLIAEHYNQNGYNLNLNLAEALGLLHDAGRTFSHRRGRNDLIGTLILKKAGFLTDFILLLKEPWDPVRVGVGQVDSELTYEKIISQEKEIENAPYRLILRVADILSRFDETERLITPEKCRELDKKAQQMSERKDAWPSEYTRQLGLKSYYEKGTDRYSLWFSKIEEQTGVSLSEIVKEMEKRIKQDPVKTFSE